MEWEGKKQIKCSFLGAGKKKKPKKLHHIGRCYRETWKTIHLKENWLLVKLIIVNFFSLNRTLGKSLKKKKNKITYDFFSRSKRTKKQNKKIFTGILKCALTVLCPGKKKRSKWIQKIKVSHQNAFALNAWFKKAAPANITLFTWVHFDGISIYSKGICSLARRYF